METSPAKEQPANPSSGRPIHPLAYFIFTTRWLQLPLYLG
jgi:hypothetical protein